MTNECLNNFTEGCARRSEKRQMIMHNRIFLESQSPWILQNQQVLRSPVLNVLDLGIHGSGPGGCWAKDRRSVDLGTCT